MWPNTLRGHADILNFQIETFKHVDDEQYVRLIRIIDKQSTFPIMLNVRSRQFVEWKRKSSTTTNDSILGGRVATWNIVYDYTEPIGECSFITAQNQCAVVLFFSDDAACSCTVSRY